MKRDAKPLWMLLGGSTLLLVAMAILAGNESHVLTYRAAAIRHGGEVVDATRSGPTIDNDGDMVLVSGTPRIVKPAVDRQFGIRADVPILWRITEMFQWRQIEYAGSTSYELEWVDHPVDSSVFEHPAHHGNPTAMPFGNARYLAGEVRLGGFLLSRKIVLAMPGRRDVSPDLGGLHPNLAASFRPLKGALVTSEVPDSPQLGDVKVRWQGAPDQEVTVIALNRDGTLVPAEGVQDGAGFQLQVGKLHVVDLQPDLPARPFLPWVWRVLAMALAVAGARVLLQGTSVRSKGMLPALGMAITLVCGLAGVMWVPDRIDVGLVLIGAALLSLGVTAWRMYERLPSR
jgi:hypothetical protein